MSSSAATVGIRAMGRAELPVRIEKYDLHVYMENTDTSGLGLHSCLHPSCCELLVIANIL
jgi:hypothetical protein